MIGQFQQAHLVEHLLPAVYEAGTVIMQIQSDGVVANRKDDGSPVTAADKASEDILLSAITSAAPSITIISEENVASHGISPPDRFFLVDPLDGTKEFLRPDGQGAFTVNIALIEQGKPVMGIVYAPALAARFTPAMVKRLLKVLATGCVRLPCVPYHLWGSPPLPAEHTAIRQQMAGWHPWISKTTAIGSSLKFCLVAAGEADVYPRFGPTMEWDTAAGDGFARRWWTWRRRQVMNLPMASRSIATGSHRLRGFRPIAASNPPIKAFSVP